MTSRPIAFLDADVLSAPMTRTLILVSAAHEDARFVFRWSRAVEAEADRHARVGQTPVSSLRAALDWDSMLVPDPTDNGTAPVWDTSPKDRHVLAAASTARARVVLTRNVADFGLADLTRMDMVAVHPDAFLAATMSESMYVATLEQMSAARTRAPNTPGALHAALGAGHPLLHERMMSVYPEVDQLPTNEAAPSVVFRGELCVLCGRHLEASRQVLCSSCRVRTGASTPLGA